MKKTTLIIALISTFIANFYTSVKANTYQGQASYIMAGTPLDVSLNNALGSAFSNVGDTFSATLANPIYAGSQVVAGAGSKLEGFVTEVTPAGRGGKPGSIDLKITHVVTANGKKIPLNASIDKRSFKLQANGGRTSHYTKATAAGAAGGALSGLIGSAIGGGKKGKSTAIGTGIGAGVGILGASFKKGKEFTLSQGSNVSFVVDSATAIQAPAPSFIQQHGSNFGTAPSGGFADPYAQQQPTMQQAQPIQQKTNSGNYNPYL